MSDNSDRTTELIVSLVEETPGLVVDRETDEKVRFAVTSWPSEKRLLFFEVLSKPPSLKLSLYLGPGETSVRERVFNLAKNTGSPFLVRRNTLAKVYTRLYIRDLAHSIPPGKVAKEDFEEVVESNWSEFVESDLPRMRAALLLNRR